MASHADKMQLDEVNSTLSSSPISSAPGSPHSNQDNALDTIRVLQPSSATADRGGVVMPSPNSATTPAAQPQAATSKIITTPQPDKPKRVRKKKELGPDGKPIDDGKSKVTKPRKPREPKEKVNGTATDSATNSKTNASTTTSTSTPATTKKKTKSENDKPVANLSVEHMIGMPPAKAIEVKPAIPEPIQRPVTSGQKYDPIRGMTMDVRPPPPPPPPLANSHTSAAPSIANLIDPPVITTTTTSTTSSVPSPPSAVNPTITHSSPPTHSPTLSKTSLNTDGPMDVDEHSPPSKLATSKVISKASSAAQTPKISAVRSTPPASRATGSGLLSSSDLFGGSGSTNEGRRGVNIEIHIKLDPKGGNHINVTQEIIKKYGPDAINPRAAQHRERLAQVMAAANKIEAGASTDDMSIDLMSELGDDSNIEMGGMDEDSEKPRKRRKKTEEYDLDDEFIDDTELAWQQQAAVAKDGFFVYSGPLIAEGETARVEATNTSARSKASRAKGARKTNTAAPTHASLADKKDSSAASPAPTAAAKPRAKPKAPAAPRKKTVKTDKEPEKPKAAASVVSTLPVPPPLPVPPAQTTTPSTLTASS